MKITFRFSQSEKKTVELSSSFIQELGILQFFYHGFTLVLFFKGWLYQPSYTKISEESFIDRKSNFVPNSENKI